ncbi:membrane protein [Clarias magur]|uniref:Membrane protein n=1 Tax=Clarias magur TaxID=1594786 RepID=A0A8J4UPP3_CLAMG|nr:membrane protein [Clarias magur]
MPDWVFESSTGTPSLSARRAHTLRSVSGTHGTPGLHYLPVSQACTPYQAGLGTSANAFILPSLERAAQGQGPVLKPFPQQHTTNDFG